MRAISIPSFGGPEVLQLVERPAPQPARSEVLVRVRACGVNRADLLQRMGRYPAPPDAPADVPGLEFAGEVEALGSGVTDVRIGQRVFGLVSGGAYAERVVVHARALAHIPEGIDFAQAAAVPEAFITAYDAMVDQAHLAAGEVLLVSAVGSGVGTAAVQIARAIGARSIGTARTSDKIARAKALGMDDGIVPQNGEFATEVRALTAGRGVDVVLELVGGPYLNQDLACLAPRGRVMLVGLLAGVTSDFDFARLMGVRAQLRGTTLRNRPLEEKIAAAQSFVRHVVPLLALGKLRPVVDRVFPLADAAAAHAYMASNAGFGKIVLDCS
jgi:putative PIG3 family NAD(P)H quinone oxidoreductase